jgi:hypothetical protein
MLHLTQRKPKPTDAERHRRFVAMAREVQAPDDPKAFDKAFRNITDNAKGDKVPRKP